LLFLYREVLGVKLPWLDDVKRPTRPRRIPSVLTAPEVAALRSQMAQSRALWELDRQQQRAGVEVPDALALG
jgi:hypothetical protein